MGLKLDNDFKSDFAVFFKVVANFTQIGIDCHFYFLTRFNHYHILTPAKSTYIRFHKQYYLF